MFLYREYPCIVIVADYTTIIIVSSVIGVLALIALICAFQFIRQVPRFNCLFYITMNTISTFLSLLRPVAI